MADSNTLLAMWYRKRRPWLSLALLPVSWLFHAVVSVRRAYFRYFSKAEKLPVPLIVVGNITLGGSGKSPLLISLAQHLKERGFRPGIVSRGYGSQAPYYPFPVTASSDPAEAGDEPLMIAQRSGCPVMIAADRRAAAQALVESGSCDVILSDDGLQHYALRRDLEIIVVDGQRRLGNERLLPAGPLREAVSRLREVEWVIINGASPQDLEQCAQRWKRQELFAMHLQPRQWRRLQDDEVVELEQLFAAGEGSRRVHAVAGIGNPQRFYDTLAGLGLEVIAHPFADHYKFRPEDLAFGDDLPVVMTEKDAVKCRSLVAEQAAQRVFYLSVQADVSPAFLGELEQALDKLKR